MKETKSALENVEEKIKAIKEREKEIGAFISLDLEGALKKAKEIDSKKNKGKLAGKVVCIKDNICVKGMRCTAASKMLENYFPPYNATVVEKILEEDGIIIGKTNLDEFACGSDNTKSAFKITRNPFDTSLVTGGSSGGSAAAVAAGFADFALGSDTGGSIRCPASFCGVVGFKPTYGTVSRHGLIDLAMSLDQIGPFAVDTPSASLLLEVIAGEDYRDSTTRGSKKKEFSKLINEKKAKMRIAVPKEFFEGIDSRVENIVRKKIEELEEKHEIKEISMKILEYSVPIYFLNAYAEFSSGMQRYDGLKYGANWKEGLNLIDAVSEVRNNALGIEVKRRILMGTYITMKEFREAWYSKTLKARRAMKNEFEKTFKEFDLIIGPAMPCLPWRIGERTDNPIQMYLADVLTCPANLAGVPAGVTNAGKEGKLPIGIQVMGKWNEDEKVLSLMNEIESMK